MASTYAPISAFNFSKVFISNAYLEQLSPQILDDINKIFWMYKPWRWTLGSMPSVQLAANTQDYAVTLPGDFLYLQTASMYDGKNTRPIKPAAFLPAVVGGIHSGQVNQVAVQVVSAVNSYRVLPVPGTFPSGAASQQVIGLYKKTAPVITSGNQSTPGVLVIPDEYFWVYEEGVLWRSMYWAQDQRAGAVKVSGNQSEYSGQLARFMDGLNQVAEMEKLNYIDKQQEDKP